MKILRTSKSTGEESTLTLKEALEILEEGGWYRPHSVAQLLHDGQLLQTSFFYYEQKTNKKN